MKKISKISKIKRIENNLRQQEKEKVKTKKKSEIRKFKDKIVIRNLKTNES